MSIQSAATAVKFSRELEDYIREWRDKPGNLIMILHRVQEELKYIPREAAMRVAELLDIPLAKIYGVITFYHFFKLTRPGVHNVQVCLGTACYLKGSEDVLSEIESLLGISVNQCTSDGEFSIEAVRCVGCCGLAPVIVIDGDVYGKMTKKDVPDALAKYRKQTRVDA